MRSRIYVPVSSGLLKKYRKEYLEKFKKLDNLFVFVHIPRTYQLDVMDQHLEELRDNLAFLEAEGIDAGVWEPTLGYGDPIYGTNAEIARDFTRITDLEGHVCGDAMCPTCDEFVQVIEHLVKGVAKIGAKRLMLDDELCLSVRPGLGCACDTHLKMFGEIVGQPVTRKELNEILFHGKPHPWRKIWMDLMGDTLKQFCARLRRAADEVNPDMEMGFCAGYTSWDLEGVDAIELTKVLAGKNQPFLRLTGAPYWAQVHRFLGQDVPQIVEFSRMQRKWCEDSGLEVFSEDDTYPRPRFRVPAAIMETFDFCMSADSDWVGCIKYMFDYMSEPNYEDGYFREHLRNTDMISRVKQKIGPMADCGVYVYEKMRKVSDMILPPDAAAKDLMSTASFSASASLLSSCTIPISYEDKESCVTAAFGDSGRTVKLQPGRGYIIDYPAAVALQARGIDVGLGASKQERIVPVNEYFCRMNDAVSLNDCTYCGDGFPVFYRCEISDGAVLETSFTMPEGSIPGSYRYENADGMKFLVFLFDASAIRYDTSLSCSYHRQEQIISACQWMGHSLPAVCRKNPNFYLICKQTEGKLAVAWCNFSLDTAYEPVIELSQQYKNATFIGNQGNLLEDRLLLADAAPWSFGAVILEN